MFGRQPSGPRGTADFRQVAGEAAGAAAGEPARDVGRAARTAGPRPIRTLRSDGARVTPWAPASAASSGSSRSTRSGGRSMNEPVVSRSTACSQISRARIHGVSRTRHVPDHGVPLVVGQVAPLDVEMHLGVVEEVAQRPGREGRADARSRRARASADSYIGISTPVARPLDQPRQRPGVVADVGDDMRPRPAGHQRRRGQRRVGKVVEQAGEIGGAAARPAELRAGAAAAS